jgi:hypothetical protein
MNMASARGQRVRRSDDFTVKPYPCYEVSLNEFPGEDLQ